MIFSQFKEKYVFMNKNLILEYVEENNVFPITMNVVVTVTDRIWKVAMKLPASWYSCSVAPWHWWVPHCHGPVGAPPSSPSHHSSSKGCPLTTPSLRQDLPQTSLMSPLPLTTMCPTLATSCTVLSRGISVVAAVALIDPRPSPASTPLSPIVCVQACLPG